MASGDLDPETTEVVRKLMDSFSASSKIGNEQKPVFGVRELEESDFIFNSESVQRHQKEISVTNQKTSDGARDDAFLSLPEIPKGTLISSW